MASVSQKKSSQHKPVQTSSTSGPSSSSSLPIASGAPLSASERQWLAFKAAVETTSLPSTPVKRSEAEQLGQMWAEGLKKGMYKTGKEWAKAVFKEVQKASYVDKFKLVHLQDFKTRLANANQNTTLPPHEMMAGLIEAWSLMEESKSVDAPWLEALPFSNLLNSEVSLSDEQFLKDFKKAPEAWQSAFMDYVQTSHHQTQLKEKVTFVYNRNGGGTGFFGKVMSFKYHQIPKLETWIDELTKKMTTYNMDDFAYSIIDSKNVFDQHILLNLFKNSLPHVAKSPSTSWKDYYSLPVIQKVFTSPLKAVQAFKQELSSDYTAKKALFKYGFSSTTLSALEKQPVGEQKKIKDALWVMLMSALSNTDEYFQGILSDRSNQEKYFKDLDSLAAFAHQNSSVKQDIQKWFETCFEFGILEPSFNQYAKGLFEVLNKWAVQTSAVSPEKTTQWCGPAVLAETLLGLVDQKTSKRASKSTKKGSHEKAMEAFVMADTKTSNFWSLRATTKSKSMEEWMMLKTSPQVCSRFTKKRLEKQLVKTSKKGPSVAKKRL